MLLMPKWLPVTLLLLLGPISLASCTEPPPEPTPPLPPIISRTEWAAREPDHAAREETGFYDPISNPGGWRVYDQPLAAVLHTLVIHHSALPVADGPLEIQALHMENKGYADIGYHFLIDATGQIFEGRPLDVRGAHTGGFNTGLIGVVLLGNFEERQPAEAQMDSLRTLTIYLRDSYQLTHLAGHRDFQPGETVCPGAFLAPLLPPLAAEMGLIFGTGGYTRP